MVISGSFISYNYVVRLKPLLLVHWSATTPAIIFCSGFYCDRECRQSLRPPCVRFRFGLWLPILGNSAQYLTMPHFPFSSPGSRPGRKDLNPGVDINIIFPVSCLLTFSFMLQGMPPRTSDWGGCPTIWKQWFTSLWWVRIQKRWKSLCWSQTTILRSSWKSR